MEVILLERIERLGQMGDVVNVKPGFARNYLLPSKKALRATKENREVFESKRAQLETDNLKRRSDAESAAAKMDGVSIVVIRQAGESGNLYGSVTARDVAVQLTADGYTVDKGQVTIGQPIKELGVHDVRVALHPEVAVVVSVNVAQSEDEARAQVEAAALGQDVSDVAAAADTDAPAEAPAVEELFENPEQALTELADAAEDDVPEDAATVPSTEDEAEPETASDTQDPDESSDEGDTADEKKD